MSRRRYPRKPPFPHHGVSSIEGLRLEAGSRHVKILARTHLFGAVEGSLRTLAAYLDGYEPQASKEGRIVVVQGDHGSGKTHTIHYTTGRLARGRGHKAAEDKDRPAVRQMYAKADDERFFAVFQELMGYMDVTYMAELNSAFLKSVASETNESESDSASLLEQLKRDPELINDLFESGVVEEGEVQSEQAKEMGRVKRRKEFQNAFYYGSSLPELQAPAFEWFCGRPISEEHCRRLGVEGPLESSEDAKSALGLLARLFDHAGVPLILYLDQYEKLVLRQDGSPHVENVGIIRSLVEIIAREQGALVLAGIPAAWEALTPDVRERVGNDFFELTTLTLDEARDIVALYLTPPDQARRPGKGDVNLYPFEPDAIRAMMGLGGGNLRRLLQLASGVFEAAQTTEALITAELVEEVARKRNLKFFDRQTVVADIERFLAQRSLGIERAPTEVPVKTDFMVTSRGGGRLLIKVKHALFHDDEVVSAIESLNYISAARQLDPPARVVLVAAGYVSPEVTDRIRKVVHDLIVYQPDSFATRFSAMLDQLEAATVSVAAVAVADEQLSRELGEIRLELQSLAESRSSEADLLEARFAKLFDEQSAARETERHAETWNAWPQERDEIRQRIQDVRREREVRDLEEMDKLRHIAEKKRWRSTLVTAGALFAAGTGLGIISTFVSNPLWTYRRGPDGLKDYGPPDGLLFKSLFFELGLFGGMVLAAMLVARLWLGDQRFSELVRPFGSRVELHRAARSLEGQTRYLLRYPVPQVRYAAAVSRGGGTPKEDFVEALRREPSALVRYALARDAGRRHHGSAEFPPELEPRTPDGAFFLESWIAHGGSELPARWRNSESMATLAAICGGILSDKSSNLVLALAHRNEKGPEPLAEAFERGLSPDSMSDLKGITRTMVERAIEQLSPFDQDGLGTYDDLECIRDIDAYYLFFRQLLFVMERGVGPESS